MKKYIFVAAVAVLAFQAPAAKAATVVAGPAGQYAPAGSYDNLDTYGLGAVSFYSPILQATVTGGTLRVGNYPNIAAPPFMGVPDPSAYISVGPDSGSPTVFQFSSLMKSFSLFVGSLDTYNSFSFYNGVTNVAVFTGSSIDTLTALNADGNQASINSNRLLTFAGMTFDRVELASTTQNALEFDNVRAAPVPGPIVGAGIPGLVAACAGLLALARRRRKEAAAA